MIESVLAFLFKILGPGLVLGLLLGAATMAAWDRRPPGAPALDLRGPGVLSFVHWRWTAPDSLAARLAQDRQASVAQASTVARLRTALTEQNRAILDQRAAAARWLEAAAAKTARTRRETAWRMDLANRLSLRPAPADTSELGLCRAADAILKEGAE